MRKLYMLTDLNTDRSSALDVMSACVVRSNSPKRARRLAAQKAMDEGKETWLDPKLSRCLLLKPEGVEQVVMVDRYAK